MATLSIGWLIAIALVGGIATFLTIGLLLSRYLKRHREPMTADVYVGPTQTLSTRLSKRHLLASEYSLRRLSTAPTLPPLAAQVVTGGCLRRSRSWVDEEALHGPKVEKEGDGWFGRQSWFGRVPTLPRLDGDNKEEEANEGVARTYHTGELLVQKRRMPSSQTAPALDDRGRLRMPAQVHVRPSATEADLRDILRSTDQRLREGSNSPTKRTPRSSPTKHTPRSARSKHSQQASVSSIGSAANSLIREATEQLVLPGGVGSPSRMRGAEWTEPDRGLAKERGRGRERDIDRSDSSSLSTVYSAEEKEDPFVEKEGTPQVPRRNPLRMTRFEPLDEASPSAVPDPLNTSPTRSGFRSAGLPIILQPPSRVQSEDVSQKRDFSAGEESMVSVSVYTDPDLDAEPELPSLIDGSEKSSPKEPSTPTKGKERTMERDCSSSPYDEQDILHLILSESHPKRALPSPPRGPTALTPAPSIRMNIEDKKSSDGSADYSSPTVTVQSLSPRPSPGTARGPQSLTVGAVGTVGNTIAQLRRMNSVVSSYSVASLASTIQDSPTLSTLRVPRSTSGLVGGVAASNSAIGSRHYFALGNTTEEGKENVGLGLRVPRENSVSGGLREGRGGNSSPVRGGDGKGAPIAQGRSRDSVKERREKREKKLGAVKELVLEERKRESKDSLGLYDQDGFLMSSPEMKGRSPR